MTVEELIALRLSRQHLTDPAPGEEICRDLNGIQAQFLSHSRHALAIRGCSGSDWNRGLVKSWTLRGLSTCFGRRICPCISTKAATTPCAPVIRWKRMSGSPGSERRTLPPSFWTRWPGTGNPGDVAGNLPGAGGLTEQEEESVFNPWGGAIRALAEAGKLVHLVQEEKAFRLAPPFEPMGEAAAWREILRRYFTHCGPATLRDAAYFLGLSQRELKRQMQDLDLRGDSLRGAGVL